MPTSMAFLHMAMLRTAVPAMVVPESPSRTVGATKGNSYICLISMLRSGSSSTEELHVVPVTFCNFTLVCFEGLT